MKMPFGLGRAPEPTEEARTDVVTRLRPRYAPAVQRLAAALRAAAAANAEMENLLRSVQRLDVDALNRLPAPWRELRGERVAAWLRQARECGFL